MIPALINDQKGLPEDYWNSTVYIQNISKIEQFKQSLSLSSIDREN